MWMTITSRAVCASRLGLRQVGKRRGDAFEVVAHRRPGAAAGAQDVADDRLDGAHGAPLRRLAGDGGDEGLRRTDEGVTAVEAIEVRDQAVERRRRRRSRPAHAASPRR
ncbi:MAG: hypothetical protein U0802_13480 [Candidatus Binatia bacterium]